MDILFYSSNCSICKDNEIFEDKGHLSQKNTLFKKWRQISFVDFFTKVPKLLCCRILTYGTLHPHPFISEALGRSRTNKKNMWVQVCWKRA